MVWLLGEHDRHAADADLTCPPAMGSAEQSVERQVPALWSAFQSTLFYKAKMERYPDVEF